MNGQADKFCFKDPEKAIEQITQLTDGNMSIAIKCVLNNLIQRNEIDTAKTLYKRIIEETPEMRNATYPMEYILRNAEYKQMVYRILDESVPIDEKCAIYQLLESGIKKKSINLKSIVLGKKSDGIRDLTLADIWEEEKVR